MKICVLGLWHLGSVTAACMASVGHSVLGLDFDEPLVARLNTGASPLLEPHLEELLHQGLASGRLRFTSSVRDASAGAQVLWVAYDTPIGEDGQPQPEHVMRQLERVLPHLEANTLVLVSSQLPVGSTAAEPRSVSVPAL